MEERTLNFEVPLPALPLFCSTFWARVLPLLTGSSAQSGRAELGTLLPSSGSLTSQLEISMRNIVYQVTQYLVVKEKTELVEVLFSTITTRYMQFH